MTVQHVSPESLRIDYKPYEKPLVAGYYRGEAILHYGRLRAVWDSPDGPYAVLTSVRGQLHPSDIETMRPYLAERLARSYEQARVAS